MKIKNKKLKKAQTFYIVKFFYYFLLILPVLIYLIGIRYFVGDIAIDLDDSCESKALLFLSSPETVRVITKDTRDEKITKIFSDLKEMLNWNKKPINFYQICEIGSRSFIGPIPSWEKEDIICYYKFVK